MYPSSVSHIRVKAAYYRNFRRSIFVLLFDSLYSFLGSDAFRFSLWTVDIPGVVGGVFLCLLGLIAGLGQDWTTRRRRAVLRHDFAYPLLFKNRVGSDAIEKSQQESVSIYVANG